MTLRPLRPFTLAALATLGAVACGGYHRAHPYLAAPAPIAAERAATDANDFHDWGHNPWIDARAQPRSTFAADVDTASYTIARRLLREGTLPPAAAVRPEELINYFRYAAPPPPADSPFAVVMDAAPHPLAPGHLALRVAVSTQPRRAEDHRPAHLVFLVDVSGSMDAPDRLPLAQQALRLLTHQLGPRDTVALVTYAGATRVVLPPTGADRKGEILAAIDDLTAGGSTAMASGLDLAYEQALRGVAPGATARVIVCTDGDTNVGPTSQADLLRIIGERARAGVTLSTIGFGMGNYKDALMERLADQGNGNNFYIDSPAAARRVFVDQLAANLEVLARDVKLQVELDPELVARYRLVGYENRALTADQFRDDRVDAGEIGPGHQVTALYELELTAAGHAARRPLGAVRIRHKAAEGDAPAQERAFAMAAPAAATLAEATADLRFALAVGMFADVLRGQADAARWSLAQIGELARGAAGDDADRHELVGLIDAARRLRGESIAIAR